MAKKLCKTSGPTSIYNLKSPICFHTIKDGCVAFGLRPIQSGWLIKAGARFKNALTPNPKLEDVTLWFPQERNIYWCNTSHGKKIIEIPKSPDKNFKQIVKYLIKPELRITFLKKRGAPDYEFVGVYALDKPAIYRQEKCVWKRVMTTFHPDLREIIVYLSKNKL
ncbi:MAG: hypothetical protein IJR69_09170 [Bacteroidaceae bacterium]|nr:hypothetical protein [Bacteroidaceae bacterium]